MMMIFETSGYKIYWSRWRKAWRIESPHIDFGPSAFPSEAIRYDKTLTKMANTEGMYNTIHYIMGR